MLRRKKKVRSVLCHFYFIFIYSFHGDWSDFGTHLNNLSPLKILYVDNFFV